MSNLSKTLQPRSWRTEATHQQYHNDRQADLKTDTCPLCSAPSLHEFTYWRIIDNKYPYDAVTSVHHMILPKAHKIETALSDEEVSELYEIKTTHLNEHYGFVAEALPKHKSIPGHYHLHLFVPKLID
jgi:hypothetical protein